MSDEEPYVSPAWLSLIFASRAEIAAAAPEDREQRNRFVEAFLADPGSCGFRRETAADLDSDDAVDRALHGANQDLG